MNLSFAGCGFLGIYHIGVASCFREYAPHVLVSKIAGASVGSLAAAALICDISLGQTTTDVLKVAVKARARALGPLHPGFDLNQIIKDGLVKALPENAHTLCSGRLFISCTRFPDGKNIMLSKFESRDELIQALLASCFIPLYSGIKLPIVHGQSLMDGGLSDNLPVLDENTITVSPFAGEHDICPEDESCNILQINLANTSISISAGNMYRFARILFPPHPEVLSKMCQQGFDDALKYLQRHNLISCTRCMAVQSCLTVSETSENDSEESSDCELEHAYDDCMDCRYRRQMALLDTLPESVVTAIQDACDQVNKGVINWLFRHRPIKLLSILGLPYVLPFDISILIFCKIWQKLPLLQKEIQAKYDSIIALTKSILNKIDSSRHLYSAKFSCQLAITEFDYTEENVSSSYALPKSENPVCDSCKIVTERKRLLCIGQPGSSGFPFKASLSPPDARQQRKSYAGIMNTKQEHIVNQPRRMSMCDINQPERVIRNMKFGFTVDLTETVTLDNKRQNVMDAFKSLGEEDSEVDVIGITNQALNWERECIGQYHGDIESENADTLGKILNVTSNEAVMSYYYMDDNKTVKVTELYNVNDADTSAVLSQEERETNENLQWENDWISDPKMSCCDLPTVSIADSFDDKEFGMSDTECDLTEGEDFFQDLKEHGLKQDGNSLETMITAPRRKTSFIIVK